MTWIEWAVTGWLAVLSAAVFFSGDGCWTATDGEGGER